MESLDVQEWTRIGAMNQRDPQSRAGVSPARVGEADAPLTLARSPGRRDACPTLRFMEKTGVRANVFVRRSMLNVERSLRRAERYGGRAGFPHAQFGCGAALHRAGSCW